MKKNTDLKNCTFKVGAGDCISVFYKELHLFDFYHHISEDKDYVTIIDPDGWSYNFEV